MALRLGARNFAKQLPLKRALLSQSLPTAVRTLASKTDANDAAGRGAISKILDGTFPSALSKASCTMTADKVTPMTRWSMFPRVFLIQIPVGAIYAWSMWQGPLCQGLGVVGPAVLDWSLGSVGFTFSCLAMGFGFSVGVLGPWIDRAGPRYASLVGGMLFGSGYLLSALGSHLHVLPMIWLGWGIFGGLGWGLGYMAPIVTLMKWFPDRKGTATGLSIGAFASGSFFVAPAIDALRGVFFQPPVYAGTEGAVQSKTENGVQFVHYQGEWEEAVFATSADLAKMPGDFPSQLAEGFYLVGTGNDGLTMTLATLGVVYTASMALGSMLVKEAPPGYIPEGWTPSAQTSSHSAVVKTGNVSISTAMRTPQFYLMWIMLACNASAGVCVISSAKTMMGEIFASLHPTVVTAGFTTGFVSALSIANATGRAGWAAVSDDLGRKNTYFICCLAGPACLVIPKITEMAVAGTMGTVPLYAFYGTTFAIVTWYGGVLAMVPSYVADTFGTKQSGPIYGRIMTNWTFAAICTPSLLSYLKGHSTKQAIDSLVVTISPEAFQQAFKAPVSELQMLVDAKTINITRLMELAPPGTLDPSPFLYDTTFYAMGGILSLAAVSNALIRHMDPKYFMEEEVETTPMGAEKESKDPQKCMDR